MVGLFCPCSLRLQYVGCFAQVLLSFAIVLLTLRSPGFNMTLCQCIEPDTACHAEDRHLVPAQR